MSSEENELTASGRYVRAGWRQRIDYRTITMLAVLLLLWLGFTAFTSEYFSDLSGSFITARNLSNLTRAMAIVGIMGCGMVLVIVTGGIDLSVGTVAGFIGCAAAAMQVWWEWSTPPIIVVCLAIGAVIGALQGTIIAYVGIAAFIVTLGGQLVFRGGILFITKGMTIAPMRESFKYFGNAYLSATWGWILAVAAVLGLLAKELRQRAARRRYNTLDEPSGFMLARWAAYAAIIVVAIVVLNRYRGLPIPVLIMLVLMLVFTLIAEKTTFGRKIYAIGGNIAAARYSGIAVKRNLAVVYALNGLLAAVAGLILTARLNAGPTSAANMNMELDAIAAAVIGGTSMSGGVGKVAGAILGAMIMASIDNGMSMMNLMPAWQFLVKGMILVAAVWFDMRTQGRKRA
ncbi:MAG: sugar ABC transporter permease [Planctomycetota bacterium]|jgi:D-xylose transport system permease protein|nr:sugar ABC transporter permease [Planctomycetota bacterium]